MYEQYYELFLNEDLQDDRGNKFKNDTINIMRLNKQYSRRITLFWIIKKITFNVGVLSIPYNKVVRV